MKTKFKLPKRILSLVMAFVMVLGMMPMSSFTAFAADATVTDTAADTTYPYAVVDTAAGTVTIDGTLGGKTTATDADITALVNAITGYVDSGITTIIVTGSEPATIEVDNISMTAIGEAIYRLSGSAVYDESNPYNGKIDLILPDVTEIVDYEFQAVYALNSITLPNVTKLGANAFQYCYYLTKITFGSVVTEGNQGTAIFYKVGTAVDGCDLYLNHDQEYAEYPYYPIDTGWLGGEWKSITLAHFGGVATCTTQAVCVVCGTSYGEFAAHSFDETTGFCSVCGGYQPAVDSNSDGYYEISNAGQLFWFANLVNTYNEEAQNTSANAILTENITINQNLLSSLTYDENGAVTNGDSFRAWTPIGSNYSISYTGTFDGNNKTVSGLYFNSATSYVGLFGYVGSGGTVKNVGVIDSYLSGYQGVGGVVGNNKGTVNNCYNSGTVTGEWVGGVVGNNEGTVTNCYNTGTVTGGDYSEVGGVVGLNYSTVESCYNTGTVSGGNSSHVGGVVGGNAGTVESCYNTGTVSGSDIVGGVVGGNAGTVQSCYNTGTVSGSDYVGGVVGNIESGTVTNCYNSGSVSGSDIVGGVVGCMFGGTVQSCYNSGSVSGSNYVGGVVGQTTGTVESCYNTGSVSGSSEVGGVVGSMYESTVTNCYYNTETYTGNAIGTNEEGTVDALTGGKTAAQFASGEVAYLLNGDQSTIVFKQTLGTDDYPNFTGAKVYYGYNSCAETATAFYTNDSTVSAEKPAHSGGTATCQKQAVCEICGTSYGELNSNNHESEELTYNANEDGTQHTATYSCCGATVTEDHSGGTATCQKQAVCVLCGTSYGELNPDNHEYVNGVCPCGAIAPIAKNENGVYEIYVPEQLVEFAQIVNGTHETIPQDKAANAILMDNIDMDGIDWTPICSTGLYYNTTTYTDKGYEGTFDGGGHTISNLKITGTDGVKASYGLFGTLSGTVKNLGMSGMTFSYSGSYDVDTTDARAGAIAGQMLDGSLISDCFVVDSSLTPNNYIVGGIAGCNYAGTIQNCYTKNVTISAHSRCGNLVSDTRGDISTTDRPGTVKNCYTDASRVVGTNTSGSEYITGCVANILDSIFASGEITYKLNADRTETVWYQKDGMPAFSGSIVYENICGGDIFYSTTDGDFDSHNIGSDYRCTNCGNYEPATLVTAENYSNLGLDSSYVGYYAIKNASNLYWYSERERIGDISGSIVLLNDITLDNSKAEWVPIVWDGDCTFDGRGNTITLKLDYGTTQRSENYGLFGTCNFSVVKNLVLDGDLTVNTTGHVGAVAGSMYRTTVSGVISTANVTNTCTTSGSVGGLAGCFGGQHDTARNQYSKIENSAVYANVTGYNAGGLVGEGWGGYQYWDITNAAYVGNVTTNNTTSGTAGAIVGYQNTDYNTSTFTNIYWCENDGLDFYGKRDTENQVYTNTEAKTEAQFASGEVAYLLGSAWGQTLGTDAHPVIGGETVYQVKNCKDDTVYSNTNENIGHIYAGSSICTVCGAECVHSSYDANGFCTACGGYQPAVLTTDKYDVNGDEVMDAVYEISNAGQLYWFAAVVNGGYGDVAQNESANAVLTKNITVNQNLLSSLTYDENGNVTNGDSFRAWTPIGISEIYYSGTFDGNNKTVSGLYFNNSATQCVGLFSRVGSGGEVQNVGVVDSYLSGKIYVGGVVGYNRGTVTNCYNTGTVTGSEKVGGVVGYNRGTVTNCYNTGTVSGSDYVGGVVGSNQYGVRIANCYNTGSVSGTGIYVGGVVGWNQNGTVTNCYNTGTVSGSRFVGGVVGENYAYDYGTVTNCYNTGAVSGSNLVGGVVGENYDTVQNCYNTGVVTGSGDESLVGGVVGYNSSTGTVQNCYYLSGTAKGGINGSNVTGSAEAKTAAQFASGEVAYLLQAGQTAGEDGVIPEVWYQTIGTDDYPSFTGATVYRNILSGCTEETYTYEYSNTKTDDVITHTPGADDSDCTTDILCTVCGTVATKGNASHTEQTVPGKAPTCTESGLTDGVVCSVCGTPITAQEEIPATGHTEELVPGKAPTCTEPGLTDGVICSVCGEPITAQEEIPATGHTEETVTGKAPTCTESGLTDGVVCSVCGTPITAQEEIPATGIHVDEDNSGRCDTCNCLMQPAKLVMVSISLKGNIALNYYMLLSDEVLADSTAYMQFTMADGEIIQIPVSEGVATDLNGETYYKFTCAVNAKEMTDVVLSQFFYAGGSTTEFSYTVKTYADYIISHSSNANEVALAKAMLHYGAAAQMDFDYNTDDLANADLEAPDYSGVSIEGYTSVSGQGTELATFYSASLILKSETTLRFFFTGSITATYNGQELEVKERGGLYYVDVVGIAAKDLDEDVTITINDGTNTADVTYNPMAYCTVVQNDTTGTADQAMKNLVAALYLYNQAANTYFEEN